MGTKQMLKYHLLLPGILFVGLLIVGVPLLTAFFVACMAGCASMMFMMGGGHSSKGGSDNPDDSRRHVRH